MSKLIKSFNVHIDEVSKVEVPVGAEVCKNPEGEDYDDVTGGDSMDYGDEQSLENAGIKAENIINKARAEAKKILDEAMVKVEEEREIVLEQAKKNGFEEGYHQAMGRCEDIIQEAGRLKEQAVEERQAFFEETKNDMVSIIIDIAKKVVGFEISINKEDILYIVKDAVDSCTHKEYVVLKVSKDDYDYMLESRNKLLAMVQGIGEIEIKADHSLDAGSCLMETPYGAVDASVSTRLGEIEKVFRSLTKE